MVAAPTGAAAIQFVRETGLVLTAPEYATRVLAEDFGLVILPLPFELPPAPLYLSWHQRHDSDRAHAWLRGLARKVLVNTATAAAEDSFREPVENRPSRPS